MWQKLIESMTGKMYMKLRKVSYSSDNDLSLNYIIGSGGPVYVKMLPIIKFYKISGVDHMRYRVDN